MDADNVLRSWSWNLIEDKFAKKWHWRVPAALLEMAADRMAGDPNWKAKYVGWMRN